MYKAILSTIIFLSSISPLFALTYSSYIDILELPNNEDIPGGIQYVNTDVLDNQNIIKVPPRTTVDIGVDGNFSGNIFDSKIFLSKDNIYQGDLTQILEIELPFDEFEFFENGVSKWRYGRVLTLENLVLQSGKNSLVNIQVSQPMEVVEYTYEIFDEYIEVSSVLKNSTNRLLNNVTYTHGDFSLTRNYQALEEYIYEYTLQYDPLQSYVNLGYPSLYDPNIKEICASNPYTAGNLHNIFLISGEDIYVDLGTELLDDFCVTQLGYTINLGEISFGELEEDEAVVEEDGGKEDDNSNGEDSRSEDGSENLTEIDGEDIGEVLGIEILPKTGVGIYLTLLLGFVLVALGILCYYLTNENSICNA